MEDWLKLDADPLQFFTGKQHLQWFLDECWEKQFYHFKANKERKAFLDGLFTCKSLADVLSEREKPGGQGPFVFGLDLNAAKYVNGVRETPNGEVGDSKTVWGLFEDGATLQIIQPQRFQKKLQSICAALESRFGCLVGCNAYLTPEGTQGLAPHHDDVELLVCQTQGSKTWRLHKEVDGFKLPSQPSGNLSQEAAGNPIAEVTLEVGDVLYLPRGTVHQAVAQDEPSVHLTISTYQKWTWGDLAQTMIQHALQAKDSSTSVPLGLREGLPFGFINAAGKLTGSTKSALNASKEVSKRLRDFADALEDNESLVCLAADSMAEDAITNRMPPLEDQMPARGSEPTLDDLIRLRGQGLFRLTSIQTDTGEEDPDYVQLVSCLRNPIDKHMIASYSSCGDDSESDVDSHENDDNPTASADLSIPPLNHGEDQELVIVPEGCALNGQPVKSDESEQVLVFEAKYTAALRQILASGKDGVAISDLPLPTNEKLNCAQVLWEDGIIATEKVDVPKSKRQKKKTSG